MSENTESSSAFLAQLSDQLAAAVEHAAASIVAVHARPRLASTGVHWRDGLIVTTAATVRRDNGITVTLPDGRQVGATLVGGDAAVDIAVLRVDAGGASTGGEHPPSSLPVAATLGVAGALRPGHLVLALARLDASGARVSFGAVSAVGGAWRSWKGGDYSHHLQSGLTLYPGFGGGPLVDAMGRVHGINSGGLSRHFATTIPVDAIERVIEHVMQRGYVPRGWLGVAMQPVTLSQTVRERWSRERRGLLVADVVADGPAAAGGLLVGDVVIAVDGVNVREPEDVLRALSNDAIGRSINLVIVRGGDRMSLELLVGERPRARRGSRG